MTVQPSTSFRLAAVFAAALTTAALTACAQQPDPLDGIPAFAIDQANVRVVEVGNNPRLLTASADHTNEAPWDTTVVVSRGITQEVATTNEVDLTAPAEGEVASTTLPLTIRTGHAPEPGPGEDTAERRIDFEVGTATHSAPELNSDVATAAGFLMSWRTLLNGAVGTLKLMAPEGSNTEGREAVESALLALTSANVIFPAEPVGVGGSWTVDSRVTGAAAMLRTTTYTVERLEGDTVALKVDIQQRPTQRSISLDGTEGGDSLEVAGSSTFSEGEITVDLSRPVPVGGGFQATTRVLYTGPGDNKIVQDITTAINYGG
ncbi:DUF6263 family protein [Corynebacterium mayonis]|uniref:DUF6263 family protein n=1 Tax=Corynebacterium mayonis TaxID=3062461 RepID=UPI003140880D